MASVDIVLKSVCSVGTAASSWEPLRWELVGVWLEARFCLGIMAHWMEKRF